MVALARGVAHNYCIASCAVHIHLYVVSYAPPPPHTHRKLWNAPDKHTEVQVGVSRNTPQTFWWPHINCDVRFITRTLTDAYGMFGSAVCPIVAYSGVDGLLCMAMVWVRLAGS